MDMVDLGMDALMELFKHDLASRKTFYDYIQLLSPIFLVLVGWFLSFITTRIGNKKQDRKEKINELEKLIEKIVSLQNDLKSYINTSINVVILGDSEKKISWDTYFQFFYCEVNNKYNFISKLIKINFPELSQDYELVLNEIINLEKQMSIYHAAKAKEVEKVLEQTQLFKIYSEIFKRINYVEERMIEILYKYKKEIR